MDRWGELSPIIGARKGILGTMGDGVFTHERNLKEKEKKIKPN